VFHVACSLSPAAVNELQVIRTQLASERAHARAVANALPVAGRGIAAETFIRACVDYLAWILSGFEERDQRLADVLRGSPGEFDRTALQAALGRDGRSHEALTRLAAAFAEGAPETRASQRWQAFAQYFNDTWSARRSAIEAALASLARVDDWRAVSGIDADWILEERRRYAQIEAQRPAGISLGAPTPAP
jgi:hypothetical protein